MRQCGHLVRPWSNLVTISMRPGSRRRGFLRKRTFLWCRRFTVNSCAAYRLTRLSCSALCLTWIRYMSPLAVDREFAESFPCATPWASKRKLWASYPNEPRPRNYRSSLENWSRQSTPARSQMVWPCAFPCRKLSMYIPRVRTGSLQSARKKWPRPCEFISMTPTTWSKVPARHPSRPSCGNVTPCAAKKLL